MNKQSSLDRISEIKILFISVLHCLIFYLIIFVFSYFTSNEENGPSHIFFDLKREGYTDNPLSDTYWNIKKTQNNKD